MAKRQKKFNGFIPWSEDDHMGRFIQSVLQTIPDEEAKAAFFRSDIGVVTGVFDTITSLWHVNCHAFVCHHGLVGIDVLGRSVAVDGTPLMPSIRRECCVFRVSGTHPGVEEPEDETEWMSVIGSAGYDMGYSVKAHMYAHMWMLIGYDEVERRSRSSDLLSISEIVGIAAGEAA